MLGKRKCMILKEIRQRIADENDIPYVTRECSFRGECRGTCPRCESELRYLERQLARRAALGQRVAVAALCAGMTLTVAGCSPFDPGHQGAGEGWITESGYMPPESVPTAQTGASPQTPAGGPSALPEPSQAPPGTDADPFPFPEGPETGEVAESELMGDVAWSDMGGHD